MATVSYEWTNRALFDVNTYLPRDLDPQVEVLGNGSLLFLSTSSNSSLEDEIFYSVLPGPWLQQGGSVTPFILAHGQLIGNQAVLQGGDEVHGFPRYDVERLADGRTAVVYSNAGDGAYTQIQLFSNSGARMGDPIPTVGGGIGVWANSIAALANGNVVVGSIAPFNDGFSHLQIYDANGVLVRDLGLQNYRAFKMESLSTGGFVVLSQSQAGPDGIEIYNAVGDVVHRIGNLESVLGFAPFNDIKGLKDGGFAVLSEKFVSIFNSDGTLRLGANNLPITLHTPANAVFTDATILDNGFIVLSWLRNTDAGGEITFSAYDPQTGQLIGQNELTEYQGQQIDLVDIESADSGHFISTWHQFNGGNAFASAAELARHSLGDAANDVITGDALADVIEGRGGNDLIRAGRGWNTIDGGGGRDQITYAFAVSEAQLIGLGDEWRIIGLGIDDLVKGVEAVHLTSHGSVTSIAIREISHGDFNGDGFDDVLWRNMKSGKLAVWGMAGDDGATIQSDGSIAPSPSTRDWRLEATFDFNRDGFGDLLWRDVQGQIGVWTMGGPEGNQVLTANNVGLLDNSWQLHGAADFNGDGNGDLLWRHDDGGLAIWTMGGADGTEIISADMLPLNAIPELRIVGVGDFNGDTRADILWRHNQSGELSVWGMNGAEVQSGEPLAVAPGLGWHVRGTGDFNADGKTDILWRSDANELVVWTMGGNNGSKILSGSSITSQPGSSWTIEATGNYDNDGASDILWRNSNGQLVIWTMGGMDGTTILTSTFLATELDAAWQIQTHRYDVV